MNILPKRWFGKSAPSMTGAAIRSVTVQPGEAKLMREMMELSSKLARGAADHNEKMFRGYNAGETNNWNQDFKGTYGTANTEIFTYYYRIWARARTLAKDTPHGKAIVRTYTNNVVGHDPFSLTMRLGKTVKKPHPKTGEQVSVFEPDEETNKQIVKEWRKFCRHNNFTIRRTISMMEAMMQVEAEAITIGSCLIRLWDDFPGNKYNFAIDLLESDRLLPSFHGTADTGNPIRASVEYHAVWNYPVAYWLLARHPGEFVANNYPGSGVSKGQAYRERVPAENIIHYNNLRGRAEQDLGFSELEACVQHIYMNFKYAGALTEASLASTCKPWVIEKDTPTGLTYTPSADEFAGLLGGVDDNGRKGLEAQGLIDPVKTQQQDTPNREIISPGRTKVLEWGFKMKVLDPKFPIEAAHEFRVDNNKEIATAAGISYSAMTGDFQSLGYIAAQMSKQPERDNFMVHQANIVDVVLIRIFERWLRSSILEGVFDFPMKQVEDIVDAANFKSKRWPFTDMLREVQALILKKDARLISPQQAQEELPDGIPYEDVVAQISEAKQTESAHGLVDLEFEPTEVVVKDAETDPENPTTDDDTPPTNKPVVPKGSKTAKGQKTGSVRARIAPQVLAMIQHEDNGNGKH